MMRHSRFGISEALISLDHSLARTMSAIIAHEVCYGPIVSRSDCVEEEHGVRQGGIPSNTSVSAARALWID